MVIAAPVLYHRKLGELRERWRGRLQAHIIAGPNGAGKTTFAKEFLPTYAECDEFINADLIAQGLSPFAPEKMAVRASRIVIERIRELSEKARGFSFETTLAGNTPINTLRRLKSKGYSLNLYFLWLPNPELAIERVAERVKRGGHFIPEPTIRRRYYAGLKNFLYFYRPMVNLWILFDNSGEQPVEIARNVEGNEMRSNPELYAKILTGNGL
jgi:predicted ABC-type ATPase